MRDGERADMSLLLRPLGVALDVAAGAGRLASAGLTVAITALDDLQHRATAPKEVDDATLADDVGRALFRDNGSTRKQVTVRAAHGVVTLRGTVDRPAEKNTLEARARSVAGVRDVINLIRLEKSHAL